MKDDRDEKLLEQLSIELMDALALQRAGKTDKAVEALRAILNQEPRLAEPRMEIASIEIGKARYEEAEAQAEEAIKILEAGGQWTDDLPENVLLSMAWSLLGESLRRQAESDSCVFGDPAVFEELMKRARNAFQKAEALDKMNQHAAEYAAGLERVSNPEELA